MNDLDQPPGAAQDSSRIVLFEQLEAAINAAVDKSPFAEFPVAPTDGGHDSEFRCRAAMAFLAGEGFQGAELTAVLADFAPWAETKSRRMGLVAHNLLAADAIARNDYETALHHANQAFSCWWHDIYNHRLVLLGKSMTGAAQTGYAEDLAKYLDKSYCQRPFEHFETTYNKQVYLCSPDYLTPPAADLTQLLAANAGKTVDPAQVDAVAWNTPAARYIRRSIIAGEFTYCSPLTCPLIQGRLLPARKMDKLPAGLDAAMPHLVQADFFGHAIYYFRTRVYALPAGEALNPGPISDAVMVSYTLADLEQQIAERRPESAGQSIDPRWFRANGLSGSAVFGLKGEQARIQERMATSPRELMMTHDNSCNISCPSCRVSTIIANRKQTEEYDRLVPIFLGLLKDANRLIVSGSGDPFASRHFRRVLRAIGGKETEFYGTVSYPPDFRVNLMTNGLLLHRDSYEEFGLRGLIGHVALSMDACEKESFERIRRDSKWEDLIEALRFIQTIRHENDAMILVSYFTVQTENFRQIPDFIEFCRKYRFHHAQLNMVRNFGAYTPEEFAYHNIGDPTHPEFEAFLDVMRGDELGDPFVILGNAKDYRDLALQRVNA